MIPKKFIDQYISYSHNDTCNYAVAFGNKLRGGEIIFLIGDLGSGKTTFTKGIASGIGIDEIITSPTFSLLNYYDGDRINLCHIDLYRIEGINDFSELGIEEYITKNNVLIIEWGEKYLHEFEYNLLIIELKILNDDEREIKLYQYDCPRD